MYTVHISEGVTPEVKSAWLEGRQADCLRLVAGLRDLQRRLGHDPAGQGESRGHGERVVFGEGVAATYEVYPGRRVVRILRAWSFRRRR